LNDQRIVGLDIEPFWRHGRERNRILPRFDDILTICLEASASSRGQILPLVRQERHFPHRKGFGVCEAGIEVHHLNRHIVQRDATFLLLNLRSEAHRVHIDEIDEARRLDKRNSERKSPVLPLSSMTSVEMSFVLAMRLVGPSMTISGGTISYEFNS